MLIKDAQANMRLSYNFGTIGQMISGLIWLIAAGLTELIPNDLGFLILITGGFFIFPLTRLGQKIVGLDKVSSSKNPLNNLAIQVAFIIPLTIPSILLTLEIDRIYFYPSFMLIIEVHYLTFIFLYGMKEFGF